jgi:hypothetical protein
MDYGLSFKPRYIQYSESRSPCFGLCSLLSGLFCESLYRIALKKCSRPYVQFRMFTFSGKIVNLLSQIPVRVEQKGVRIQYPTEHCTKVPVPREYLGR